MSLLHHCSGAEVIYSELMSDFEMDEKDFAADSWSLAVDSSFLQQHKKEVMKQQDVIYGKPRTPWSSLLLPDPTYLRLSFVAYLSRYLHPVLGIHVPGWHQGCACAPTFIFSEIRVLPCGPGWSQTVSPFASAS